MTQTFSQFSADAFPGTDGSQAAQERRQGGSPSGDGDVAPRASSLSARAVAAVAADKFAAAVMAHNAAWASHSSSVAAGDRHPPEGTEGSSTPHMPKGGVVCGTGTVTPERLKGRNPSESPAIAGVSRKNSQPENGGRPVSESGSPTSENGQMCAASAAKCPPLPKGAKRKSRAAISTAEMDSFIRLFGFDWLALTIPNGSTGTGEKRMAAKGVKDPDEDRAGHIEEAEAERMLTRWAVGNGLRQIRVGHGTDGFKAGAGYGFNAFDKERVATIRAGHPRDMPSLEITGRGAATLAPAALEQLGPVNISRVDVTLDVSRSGLFDQLLSYCKAEAKRQRRSMPRVEGRGDTGRTFYWGESQQRAKTGKGDRGEVHVCVYEKDLQLQSSGQLAGQADPNRVRIEFRFAPKKATAKAGLGRLAAAEGASAVLRTSLWVRRMVERLAVLAGAAARDQARLSVGRIDRLPVARTVEDRAQYALDNGARALCEEAAKQIVDKQFEGDTVAAIVSPRQVKKVAVRRFLKYLDDTGLPDAVVTKAGLDKVRTSEREAERNQRALRRWIAWQEAESENARERLEEQYVDAMDGEERELNATRDALAAEYKAFYEEEVREAAAQRLEIKRFFMKKRAA